MSNKASTLAENAAGLLNVLLPLLPVAGGPVGIGVSAAIALVPSVTRLINRLYEEGEIDATTQNAQMARMNEVVDFTGATWTEPIVPPTEPPATGG